MLRTHVRLLAAALLLSSITVAQAGPPPSEAAVQIRRVTLEDWLAAQTTYFGIFSTEVKKNKPTGNAAFVDYTNKTVVAQGLSFGFTANGGATIRKFEDGSGEVLVNLSFSNANTYALDKDNVFILGYPASQLHVPGREPALSNGSIQLKYSVPSADDAELDVYTVFSGAGTVTQLKIHTSGKGPCRAGLGVPEGTPGICNMNGNGFLPGGGATTDGWPVEHVDVRALGNAATTEQSTSTTGVEPAPTAESKARPATWGRIKALFR